MGRRKEANNSLIKNSAWLVLYRAISLLLPIITSAYSSRILLPYNTGRYAYAANIASYFTLLTLSGVSTFGIREIAKSRKKNSDEVFSSIFFINLIISVICCVVYVVGIFCIDSFRSDTVLFMITGISIVSCFFNTEWVNQGFERYKFISIRGIIIKITALVAILSLVKSENDLYLYALILSLEAIVTNIVNLDKAMKVANLRSSAAPRQPLRVLRYRQGVASELLSRCKYFEVYRMIVNTERRQVVNYQADEMAFRVLLCVNGCGTISYDDQSFQFYKGDCVFVPADSVEMNIHGQAQFLDVRG